MDALENVKKKLSENETANDAFVRCRELLFADTGEPWKQIDVLAECVWLYRFTAQQLFLTYCAEQTRANYQKAGYSEALYWTQ